jgi:soluble lytic murein transglycosylase-like protein
LKKFLHITALCLFAAPLFAAENAVLRNGFVIRHELREINGDNTRLFLDATKTSFIDVRTVDIERTETAPVEPEPPKSMPQAVAPKSKELPEIIHGASERHNIDVDLLYSIIRAESSFKQRATSHKGARGLMQLMPKTATELGVTDAYDPEQNVEGGSKYLRAMLERYDWDVIKALAAYNAGPHRVDQYKGVPPYRETRAYVAKIIREFNSRKRAQMAKAGD